MNVNVAHSKLKTTLSRQARPSLTSGLRDWEHLTRALEHACRVAQEPHFRSSAEYVARQAARSRFSPSLAYGRHLGAPLPTARRAAVMILLEPRSGQWVIPLTVRPNHLPDHPGQVCLPGGRVEQDETLVQAAEREFCEELGLTSFPVRTLGQLHSLYVYNSDFQLTPCVAVSSEPLEYTPCPDEVAELVYLPLSHLLDPQRRVIRAHARGLISWTAPGIDVGDVHLWGATAMILGELAAILEQY